MNNKAVNRFCKMNAGQLLALALFAVAIDRTTRIQIALDIRNKVIAVNSKNCGIDCNCRCLIDSIECDKVWHKVILNPMNFRIFYETSREEFRLIWEMADDFTRWHSLNTSLREAYDIARKTIKGELS